MNPLTGTCLDCLKPFTNVGWEDRHTVSDTEAHDNGLEPGDYHNTCCPLCERVDEAAS